MNKLITAIIVITLSFNAIASKKCGKEEREIIEMQERSLNHGTVRGSSTLAYARITIGSTGIIYAVVNTVSGLGALSFVLFLSGSLDIYINSKNDERLDKLKERLCS